MASKTIPAIRPALMVAEKFPAVAQYIEREFMPQPPRTLRLVVDNAVHS